MLPLNQDNFSGSRGPRRGFLVCAVILAVGCRRSNMRRTRVSAKELVSLGVSESEATLIMRNAGYTCRTVESGEFYIHKKDSRGVVHNQLYDNLTFIECILDETRGLVRSRTTVALVLDSARCVVEIIGRWEATGT